VPKGFVDLEIDITRGGDDHFDRYAVGLRALIPENEVPDEAQGVMGSLDLAQLDALAADTKTYGATLGASLFSDPVLRDAFSRARAVAKERGVPTRLRLRIGDNAPELHSVLWEVLRDPADGALLFTGEEILFSRYLPGGGGGPVRLRPQAELRVLVVVSSPHDLDRYSPNNRVLDPVNVEVEIERARKALGNVSVTALETGKPATLANIAASLRDGYHILYLVCHGAMVRGESRLWLQNDAGNAEVVAGSQLVAEFRDIEQRPKLVVLASCESGGTGGPASATDDMALTSLGRQLASTRVPAVLAMQGRVSVETAASFMTTFFTELRRDGQIDRAVALARGAVRDRPDWWMPVLFMQLISGRLWYEPGFGAERSGLDTWQSIVSSIKSGSCTPILGPALVERFLGPRNDVAHALAAGSELQIEEQSGDQLPQIAQVIAVQHGTRFVRRSLIQQHCLEIQRRYGRVLPPELQVSPVNLNEEDLFALCDALLNAAWHEHIKTNSAEPHAFLAGLRCSLFITTNPDQLLTTALSEARLEGSDPVRKPEMEVCPWREDTSAPDSLFEREPRFRPSISRPLVYHLFGQYKDPGRLVLAEDDYFDFLVGVTRNNDLIPKAVRGALNNSALLFLGYRLDDWSFRVVFRSLMTREGHGLLADFKHVAVQVDLEEGSPQDPESARKFLDKYFEGLDVDIFWGTVDDFVQQLKARLTP